MAPGSLGFRRDPARPGAPWTREDLIQKRTPAGLGLVAGGLLLLAGCGPPISSGGGSGGSGGGRAGPGTSPPTSQRPPPFTGGTRRPPPLRPPSLVRPGPAPTTPPGSTLPPPEETLDLAAEIERDYGFQVTGPGASEANLEILKRGLDDFRLPQLRGLETIDFPLVHGRQGLQGLWQSDGRRAQIKLYAQTGQRPQVHVHTVSHELGHHASLFARKTWGDQLDAALGRGAAAYPSDYSHSSDAEKVAENIAFSLLGSESERRALAGWNPSTRARSLLRSEFGARLKL